MLEMLLSLLTDSPYTWTDEFFFTMRRVVASVNTHRLLVCCAGNENDSVHPELEEERDGSLAGNLCH